ncbi:MAG TPA: glycoside hydrolase family 25 protein [Candidatus Limnocylindrales bacterium]
MARVLAALTLAFVALGAVAVVPSPRPVAAAEPEYVPGIDVSHWQGKIDWEAVAGDGIRFAFAKATEGRDFVDDMYKTNRAGAKAAGITFGAYHFARPNTGRKDPRREAGHFVRVAGLTRGDLVPALDLERTGGLSQSQLIDWTRRWVRKVERLVGEKPVIYTSPYFWRTNMANTTWFADHGYGVWVARWDTEVRVPASTWGGEDWTFWQHTDCGSVDGIGGCVDLDRFNGRRLRSVSL